ncbi:MAG: hypothetical protein HQL14_07195 [Candidatus Omnitrophica bacterium]|nr:hypothetical protein [Candidatus Omnitrophota bacterium]
MLKTEYFQRCSGVSFLTAFITLATQILVCRIVSAKLFNNYAFLVIALTMLGFAVSGVILAFNNRLLDRIRKNIHLLVWFFVLTIIGGTYWFYHLSLFMPNTFSGRMAYTLSSLYFISLAGYFAIPFIFSGLILGILLTHQRLPTRRIYCFDLMGSALGALLVVVFISYLGVERSLLILCGVFLLGANVLLPLRGRGNKLLLGAFFLGTVFLYFNYLDIFKLKYPGGTQLALLEAQYVQWDPVARIEVSNIDLTKKGINDLDLSMIGTDREFYKHIEKFLTQNNNAGTWAYHYNGNISSLKGVEKTMYSSAYQGTSLRAPNVLVIGMGAGMDILTGLYFNASKITGVDINAATHNVLNNVYKDYFRYWVNDPKVTMVQDEGRHYLTNSRDKYDIIQVTGVDSYSGTMASSNIFAESYLYTKEAIKLYYEKLTKDGIINIIRLEYPNPPREMLRMLATTVRVLREMGVKEPANHIVMFVNYKFSGASLLIKKEPFSGAEIQKLKNWTASIPYFKYITTPEIPVSFFRIYQTFLELKDPQKEEAFIRQYPLDISPVEDDKPFFFRYSRWSDLFTRNIPFFEFNIAILVSLLSVISALCVFLPLKYLLKSSVPLPHRYRHVLIFSCLGVGYFFIEIALMQKLGLFLGHPNYAISVVLSGLLLATGIGALYSKSIIQRFSNIRNVTSFLSVLIMLGAQCILPHLKSLIGWNIMAKGILAYSLLFPVGLLLGVYLPEALEQLKKRYPKYVPWGWGINGIFSVIAPVIAMAISVTFGINFLLLCSVPFYITAGYLLNLER